MGKQEQEHGGITKEGTTATTNANRSFGATLRTMFDPRTEDIRDGGWLEQGWPMYYFNFHENYHED